jgi:hypothetical protein
VFNLTPAAAIPDFKINLSLKRLLLLKAPQPPLLAAGLTTGYERNEQLQRRRERERSPLKAAA